MIIAPRGFARPTRRVHRGSSFGHGPTVNSSPVRHATTARANGRESLPDVDREHLVADDLRKLLKGKDARVAVGVTDTGMTPKSTGGFVVAVMADVRRCVVFAFETQAMGASAEDVVLDRLTLVTERLLPSLESDASFAPVRETATPRKR